MVDSATAAAAAGGNNAKPPPETAARQDGGGGGGVGVGVGGNDGETPPPKMTTSATAAAAVGRGFSTSSDSKLLEDEIGEEVRVILRPRRPPRPKSEVFLDAAQKRRSKRYSAFGVSHAFVRDENFGGLFSFPFFFSGHFRRNKLPKKLRIYLSVKKEKKTSLVIGIFFFLSSVGRRLPQLAPSSCPQLLGLLRSPDALLSGEAASKVAFFLIYKKRGKKTCDTDLCARVLEKRKFRWEVRTEAFFLFPPFLF